MLALEIQEGKVAMATKEFAQQLGSGTSSLLRLTTNYVGSPHIVVADSAFASVKTAAALHTLRRMGFIGLVKTATRSFPKAYLSSYPLPVRGSHVVLQATIPPPSVAHAGSPPTNVMALAWNDNKRKLVIATVSASIDGAPAEKKRYRLPQVGEVPSSDGLMHYKKQVPRPVVVKDYFDNANAVDVHNHFRQGALNLEDAWNTKNWWHRLFATLVFISVTDAYLAYRHFHPNHVKRKISFQDFVEVLTKQLLTYSSEKEA